MFTLIIFLLTVFYIMFIEPLLWEANQIKEFIPIVNPKIEKREKLVLDFLLNKMSSSQLSIRTNYSKNESSNQDIASGADILSESQGLFLLYLVNRNEKENFDLCLHWTMKNMGIKNGIYSWLYRSAGVKEKTNAFIDDLRILRALILAEDKWKDAHYRRYIKKASRELINYNIEDYIPIDFYDFVYKNKANRITVSYLDLYTIKRMIDINPKWEKIYENSLNIIKGAKIKDTGLYKSHYELDTRSFKTDIEISIIQSVYALLNLAEVGEYDIEGMKWLWNEYEKHGKIFVTYSYDTYQPTSDVESTALYSLAARLYYLAGESQRAKILMDRCKEFQVRNTDSDIFGSLGDETSKQAHSFDNLQYILSSSSIYKDQ